MRTGFTAKGCAPALHIHGNNANAEIADRYLSLTIRRGSLLLRRAWMRAVQLLTNQTDKNVRGFDSTGCLDDLSCHPARAGAAINVGLQRPWRPLKPLGGACGHERRRSRRVFGAAPRLAAHNRDA